MVGGLKPVSVLAEGASLGTLSKTVLVCLDRAGVDGVRTLS